MTRNDPPYGPMGPMPPTYPNHMDQGRGADWTADLVIEGLTAFYRHPTRTAHTDA